MIKKDDQWYEIGVVSWGEDSYGSDTETAALYADVQSKSPQSIKILAPNVFKFKLIKFFSRANAIYRLPFLSGSR